MRGKPIPEQAHREHVYRIYQRTTIGDRFRGCLVLFVIGGMGSAMIVLYVLGWVLRHVFHIYPPANFFNH
ncbi:MAG: hypothetical protein ACJ74Z_19935 [Bryobacteraceae bacterium]|jgi:uncharacterized protein HemY